MICPSSWTARLRARAALAPFFKSVCVYFVALGVAGERAPSPGAAACKCAPVLCLLAALLHRAAALPAAKRRYCALVTAGLALSALGDALLVWPARLAAGMAAFGAAHVAYASAFGWRGAAAPRAGAALAAGAALYARLLAPPGALGALVPAYAALLAAMAWRGVARGGAAAAGALLFLLSDAVLGYTLFVAPLPYHQVIVMSTYYAAQLGIAYSALEEYPAPLAPPATPAPPAAPAPPAPPAALH